MKVVSTSDVHLNPGDEIPGFLLDMFKEKARIVLCGDILNFLPYGKAKWYTPEGQKTIKGLVGILPENGVDYIYGNHEGNIGWLIEMFKPYPQVRVTRELNLYTGDAVWHFEHGHRFAYDWCWLQWIADDLTQFMVKVFPRAWYWLSKKMGWMPGAIKEGNPRKYDNVLGTIWGNALEWAQDNKSNLVIGHTHCHYEAELYDKIKFIDCGTKQVIRIG
jgi:UDP-2,3-diacylglucosamine pyrophosphatase LpxH